MPYAVELFFDPETDALIRKVWTNVTSEIGIHDTMSVHGSRPHIALAVFEDSHDIAATLRAVESYANFQKSFGIRLDSVGTFSGLEGVVFLSPTPDTHLLEAHAHCHSRLTGLMRNPRPYYEVNRLAFHCTLCMGLNDTSLGQALIATRKLPLPIAGRATGVGLVGFPDTKFIGDFALVS